MPKNCCMPFCKSNASRNPELYYHELPCNEDLRKAWLRNISRQGSDKNSQWQPSSRAVVCSLHFAADDYKVGVKRKLLLPTAVPTQFPSTDMLPSGSKERKTLLRDPHDSCMQARILGEPALTRDGKKSKRHRREEPETERAASGYQPQESVAASVSAYGQGHLKSGLKAEECQTTFDLVGYIAETKRNAHRLEVKVQRANERVRKLQQHCDEFREKVQRYEDNRDVQTIKTLSQAAQGGDLNAKFLMEQIVSFDKARPALRG